MNLELLDIVFAGIIICLAGLAQSAVGFGYALFATPLLVWVGIPLPVVITIVATCSAIQATIGAVHLRAAVPWRVALAGAPVRLAGVLVGVFLLEKLITLGKDQIRQVVGGILCVLVVIQLVCKPHRAKKVHWSWAGLAFVASGLLAGVCGMGGPPLVLWSMAHDWSTAKTRGFLFASFAVTLPFLIVLLAFTFGVRILWSAAIGIACLPLVYLGAAIGLPIGNRMPRETLRRVAYVILLVIGLAAVAPVVLAGLR